MLVLTDVGEETSGPREPCLQRHRENGRLQATHQPAGSDEAGVGCGERRSRIRLNPRSAHLPKWECGGHMGLGDRTEAWRTLETRETQRPRGGTVWGSSGAG